jgi:hypothetical protein
MLKNIFALIGILLMSLVYFPPVMAQSETSTGSSAEVQGDFVLSYPPTNATVVTPVSAKVENHLYHPGDDVEVTGSILIELVNQVDALEIVKVEITDGQGNVVLREDASIDQQDGTFVTTASLLDSAQSGTYSAVARLEIDADALGIVRAITAATLQSSVQFVVAEPVEKNVTAEDETFTVWIASNSGVGEVELKQEEKKLEFFVEGVDGTSGVAEISIPKELLSGEMNVFIDQNLVAKEDVLLKSATEAETTFEINYHHSIRRVEVTGTNVIPEFPIAILITAASISLVVALLAILSRTQGFRTLLFRG